MLALKEQPDHWRDFFLLLLLTGQRRNTVASMRWEHLDPDRMLWHTPAIDEKSGKPTTVVLVEQALQILRARSDDGGGWGLPERERERPHREPEERLALDSGCGRRRLEVSGAAANVVTRHPCGVGHAPHEALATDTAPIGQSLARRLPDRHSPEVSPRPAEVA